MHAADPDRSTLVVAIDGPSGSGKSTVARGVARALGLRYLDTGAMYRALTWWVLKGKVAPDNEPAVLARLATFELEVATDPDRSAVLVGDVDVTSAIRQADVTKAVSAVSAIPEVRHQLVARQRAIIGLGGIAVEGRDIGTAVCPEAPVKIFLTATADTRASRRARDVHAAGTHRTFDDVRSDLDRRDRLDSGRKTSPLHQAPDALPLDSTDMSADEVIAAVLAVVREKTGIAAGPSLDPIGGERR